MIDSFTPDPMSETAAMHPEPLRGPLVVALVHDGLCTFEFAIVAEIFGLSRPEMGADWYRYASAAVEPGPLRAHGGLIVTSSAGIELLAQAGADFIMIDDAVWGDPRGPDVAVAEALKALQGA